MIWYKQGVSGDLQPVARKGLGRVATHMMAKHGEDVMVTSIRDGNHSLGSLHYEGLAFDIRPSLRDDLVDLRRLLGPDWDVVDEGNHFHFEYDPK